MRPRSRRRECSLNPSRIRAYGSFARVLGKYVREEKLLSLEQAIRKMTNLPATNLGLAERGLLKEGYFADVAIFDPQRLPTRPPTRYLINTRWG